MAAKTFLKTALAILGFLVVLGASTTSGGQIIYVDDDGPADFSNIQAAIDDSNDGDIIIVNPGTYTGDGNRDIDFKGKAITVRGTDPNNPNIVAGTIIDCEGSDEDNHRGFYFHSGEDENSILEGLTITNGLHNTGAGICCRESSPTIRNNIITGNETGFDEDGGAGIGCWNGASPTIANNIISDNICAPGGGGGGIRCFDWCSPAITNCTFSRNWPGGINIHNSNPTIKNCTFEGNMGGGINSSYFSSPIFINCTFIGNSSPAGGGMRISESNPTLINCSFIRNVAATYGGGIYNSRTASPTLINCTFAGNSAGNYGGGIYNRDSTSPMLVNCIFTGNSAEEDGGAVYNYGYNGDVRITLNNCTFSGNSAADGNDLACDSPYGPPSDVQVTNCIIWDGENAILNNDDSTITITYSDVYGGWPGEGNIDADPLFRDPDGIDDIPGTEDDNLRLSTSSPCIDAGDPNYIAGPNETDLDGKPRVIASRIDMGAYEFQSQLILYVDADAAGANNGSSWDDAFNYLQDALAAAYSGDEIRVAQGTYKPDQGVAQTPGDREATFQLINNVTIKGGYAGAGAPDPNARDIKLYGTILSGDLNSNDVEVNDPCDLENEPTRAENSYHVVIASETDETAVLDGFIITGGNANQDPRSPDYLWKRGGGIYSYSGSPKLMNCTITRNTAVVGGGIENLGSGMFYHLNCNPTIINCAISGNNGGGIRSSGSPTLINCTISGNNGCGMSNGLGNPTLTNCTISGNNDGGWHSCDSYSTLINCVFAGNSSDWNGGAWFSWDSDSVLVNCVFVGNSTSNDGGGIYSTSDYSMTLTNCILWSNRDKGGMDASAQIDGGVNINYCCIQGWTGGLDGIGNIDKDPLFVEPGYWDANGTPDDANDDFWVDGDYHLLAGSPCIDAGDPNYVAEPNETDLDGNPRIMDGDKDGVSVVDMGAFEYGLKMPAETRILPRTINIASKGKWITCYIWLPEEYDVADIEPSSVLLEQQIKPERFSVDEDKQVATATFDREKVQSILNVGDIELTISCQLTDGTYFEAIDIIQVTDKGGGQSAK